VDSKSKVGITHGLMHKLYLAPSCKRPVAQCSDGRVNLGDALQFWTKGLLKSTVHRVLIPPKQRYSIAYFIEPNPGVVCSFSCPVDGIGYGAN